MSLDLSPWLNKVTHDHAVHFCQVLPAESVNACITSSPYYGVRSYPCEPLVWETGNECRCAGEHEWADLSPLSKRGQDAGATARVGNTVSRVAPTSQPQGAYCQRECACAWGPEQQGRKASLAWSTETEQKKKRAGQEYGSTASAACSRCGAWRGQLGSEPLHDCLAWARGEPPCAACFVCHQRTIAAGIWRVLRPDGVYLLNLGDSFAGSWGARGRGEHTNAPRPDLELKYGTDAPARSLPGIREKNLIGIPWRVALALQADGWILRNDLIWCLSGGTRLYARTQKGVMPAMLKDLVRLDPATVQLWNGERWTQVVSWTESRPTVEGEARHAATRARIGARLRGEKATHTGDLEIELRSGERIACTPTHLWPTQRGTLPAALLGVGDVIQTTTLPDADDEPGGIPDDIGWFVGLYLAEGWKDAKGISISGHVKETDRLARCQEIARRYHGTCTVKVTHGNAALIRIHSRVLMAILDTYIAGEKASGKHLTNACWRRRNTFLRAILDGYLHGDGHWDAANNRWRLGFTRNYDLEADLRTLCARLGASLRLRCRLATFNGRAFPIHKGEIRFERSAHPNHKQDGEIVAIRASRARKFWDVEVADEPHLFALASGVLTHNSKGNPMPESVTDRHTRAHEYFFHFAKSKNYYWDAAAIKEPGSENSHGGAPIEGGPKQAALGQQIGGRMGIPARNKQALVGNRRYSGFNARWDAAEVSGEAPESRNPRTVLQVNLRPLKDEHFAAYPEDLIRPLVKAACPPSGVILEPFCGSGTTPIVAVQEGRNYVACEWAAQYVSLAERRINRETGYLAMLLESPAPGTGAVSERSELLADGPAAEGGAPASSLLLPLEVAS